jgi:hypothetical protein
MNIGRVGTANLSNKKTKFKEMQPDLLKARHGRNKAKTKFR